MSMTPEPGTELVNPTAGTKTVFIATATSTDGAYVEIEATYPPGSARPPRHLHPSQEEHFTVLSGQMQVVRGEETFTVTQGDEFTVPPGTPHQMWADGDDGAVLRWRTTPALRTGELFCALWEVARDNDWTPAPLALFEVVSKFGDEFCLC
jgi:mannose-6-phosphate isomerase-like protein (cupin superfamily)